MKFKAKYAKKEDIPNGLEEYFVEKDGSWIPDLEAVDGLELANVEKMRTALETERQESADARRIAKSWGDLDPEKTRADLGRLKTYDDNKGKPDPKLEEQIKAREAELEKNYKTQLDQRDTRIGALTKGIHSATARAQAVSALNTHDGNVDLMLPHVLGQITMKESGEGDDLVFTPVVVDGDGKELMSRRSDSTGPMSVEELVERMSNDKRWAQGFGPKGQGGSGGAGGTGGGGGGGGGGGNAIQLTETDARDPMKYQAAKAAADKAGVSVEILQD